MCPIRKGSGTSLIKNRFRVVRWNDSVHQSVTFNSQRNYNNPPEGAMLVDDAGGAVGKFARA